MKFNQLYQNIIHENYGHHRLQKAINMKMSKIKAKIINVDDLPETWQFLFN
jgi:hypothetical protein